MQAHDWTVDGDVFVLAPVIHRVRLETGFAAAVAAALCLGTFALNPYAFPIALAICLPYVLLTYVSRKHRRIRLSTGNVFRVESATWRGAGRWTQQCECASVDILAVGYYGSGRTTRIALCMDGRPAFVVVDLAMSPQRAEALASALATKLDVPVQTWTWRQFVSALI